MYSLDCKLWSLARQINFNFQQARSSVKFSPWVCIGSRHSLCTAFTTNVTKSWQSQLSSSQDRPWIDQAPSPSMYLTSSCLHVFVLSSESVKYYHGEAYKYMIKSPTDLGKVRFCFCFCIAFVNVFATDNSCPDSLDIWRWDEAVWSQQDLSHVPLFQAPVHQHSYSQ